MVADEEWAELGDLDDDAPAWRREAARVLDEAPDPGHAHELAKQALLSVGREVVESRAAETPERMAQILWALCAVAPFLGQRLRRHPEWLVSLLDDDLTLARERQHSQAALDCALEGTQDAEEAAATLRRFKYFELARLTVRDCNEALLPARDSATTLRELSLLADVLLGRALEVARVATEERHGPPRWRGPDGEKLQLSFAVLGLGKLGSEELNYSSDVDLVYVFETPPVPPEAGEASDGLARLLPNEYFTRLCQRFGSLVADSSDEGFLYRVDLDLRPEGNRGPLVVSHEALAYYFEVRADTWEKASFMKARPVAGSLEFGWRAIREVDPMIFRTAMDYTAVDGIHRLKQSIESARGGRADAFDVKIDAGGIRDIEFIAQAMQLLHGGRIEQVRSRSTRAALERLGGVNLLPEDDVAILLSAYDFMRRLENRLQMEAENQTHRLADTKPERERIARALGYRGASAASDFAAELESQRAAVLHVFQSFFFEAGSDRIFELFARHVPHLLATGGARAMLDELAAEFARSIDSGSDPQRALNNLDRFVAAIGGSRFYLELLLDRPELVARLSALFAASNYLSNVLATHPALIEPVFHDPELLLLSRTQLEADFDELLSRTQRSEDDDEGILDTLRLFFYRQLLNVGLLDIGRKVERSEVEAALTDIAEVCLDRALSLGTPWLLQKRSELGNIASRTRFIVVGMGKLASRELSYGSDLDLIFVFDADPDLLIDAQELSTRLAQRLISMLQTNTSQGMCYEVDARLRPSGNQGSLVSSLAALERYHKREAQVWERQILLRARAVCGDPQLIQDFETLRRSILCRPLPDDARAQVHRIRERMETELAGETERRRDFKRGRGGLLDVENVVQLLQLEHGRAHPELLEPLPTAALLRSLTEAGALDPERSAQLAESWDFLQQLGSRLRILENRSISDLDVERGDLEGLARMLGYGSPGRLDARRQLLADYQRHTERTRRIYLDVFERKQ